MPRTVESIPEIISVDDHIQEPADLWTSRLPAKFREIGPHVVREMTTYQDVDGKEQSRWGDVWHYEDVRNALLETGAAAGLPPAAVDTRPITFDELRPGTYDATARLADMDLDHVRASLCFPNLFVRFCGQRFMGGQDKDLALACVRAYNDFLAEEWEGKGGGRLYGAAILPLWDIELVVEELHRVTSELGLRAITFTELPTRLGLPSIYSGAWEPFFKAVNDTETIVCIHIGSSSSLHLSSDDAPVAVGVVNHYCNASLSVTDMIVSGLFDRYPNIQVMYSEAEAGWIPFLLGRLDIKWGSGYSVYGLSHLQKPPSVYFQENMYACVTQDPAAVTYLEKFGSDRFCFETDYPHQDGAFPESAQRAIEYFGHLPDDKFHAIINGNAARLLRIDS